VKFKNLVIELN